MATITAQSLLDQYLANNSLTLPPLQYDSLLARLTKTFAAQPEGQVPSNLALANALLKYDAIKNVVPAGENPVNFVATGLGEAKEEVTNGGGEGPVDPTLSFTLTTAAKEVHEGGSFVITVKASANVAVDTVVDITVAAAQSADNQSASGQANWNDFGQGQVGTQKVIIKAGTNTATLKITPLDEDLTEIDEKFSVSATVGGKATVPASLELTIKDGPAPSSDNPGQTFTLTTNADFVGGDAANLKGSKNTFNTDGDDIIVANDVTLPNGDKVNTLSKLDAIDAGLGRNTLNINTEAYLASLNGDIKNIQVLNIRAADKIGSSGNAFDTTGVEGLEQINVTVAGDDAYLKAADTTDIAFSGGTDTIHITNGRNVSVIDSTADQNITVEGAVGNVSITDAKQGSGVITVKNGADVSVVATADKNSGAINVGATDATATGTVSVTQNLKSDGSTTLTSDNITVIGGKTVDVTVNATSHAKTETSNAKIQVGTVTVNGDGNTQSVTITQKADVVAATKSGTEGTAASTEVTFKALEAGHSVTIAGLTFTANKKLSAEKVAQAFASLTKLDTQSLGVVSDGFYAGRLADEWTSATASGSKVVFSGGTALPVAATSLAATPGTTASAGTAKVNEVKSTNGVLSGAVAVDDVATASIKTITLENFNDATIGSGSGKVVSALETLSLTKGKGTIITNVGDTLATLNLAVNAVDSNDLQLGGNALATLNVVANEKTSKVALTAAAVTALNVDGNTELDLSNSTLTKLETVTVKGTVGLTLNASGSTVKSVDASGTSGNNNINLDASAATYQGGSGVDKLVLAQATVSKAISLGAGDDSITLASGTTTLGAVIDGGDGDKDTLVFSNTKDAATASASTGFANKITGFERLQLQDKAAEALTVNLANLDDINYVITAGGAGEASKEGAKIRFDKAVDALTAGDTISFSSNGTVYTATIGTTVGKTATSGEVQDAIDLAQDAAHNALGSRVITVNFVANSDPAVTVQDLVLTAKIGDTLGTVTTGYADLDALKDKSVAANAVTNGKETTVGASTTFAGVVDKLITGDTFTFTYGSDTYTATIGATNANTASAAEVQAAIDTAVNNSNSPLGQDKVTASFEIASGQAVATDLKLALDTAVTNLDTVLTGGTYTDYTKQAGDASTFELASVAANIVGSGVVFGDLKELAITTPNGLLTVDLSAAGGGPVASLTEIQAAVDAAVAALQPTESLANAVFVVGGSESAPNLTMFKVTYVEQNLVAGEGIGLVLKNLSDNDILVAPPFENNSFGGSTSESLIFPGAVNTLAVGDTITFTYDDAVYTATVGGLPLTESGIQIAIDTAVKINTADQLGSDKVKVQFDSGDLYLIVTGEATPAGLDDFEKTLKQGAINPGGTPNNATPATNQLKVEADTAQYNDIVAALTQGDTIAFSYDGSNYTATIGVLAGATVTDTDVQAAIDAAVDAIGNPLGNDKIKVSFVNNADTPPVASHLKLVSAGNTPLALNGGAYSDVDGNLSAANPVSGQGTAIDAVSAADLTLENLASGGTVELTGSSSGVLVKVKDADKGSTDVLNLVANASASLGVGNKYHDLGTVTANDVETVAISAQGKASILTLQADSAQTVTISGKAGFILKLGSTSKDVKLVDASAATGQLELRSNTDGNQAVTLLGGEGNDTLIAAGNQADKLIGGKGDDILVAGKGKSTLTGGEGNDIFVIGYNGVHAGSSAQASEITDFARGDLLMFAYAVGVGTSLVTSFLSSQVEVDQNSGLQAAANAAVTAAGANEAAWFQLGGKTYVVVNGQNGDAQGTEEVFDAAEDYIVALTGAVDFTNASLNTGYGTLELV